MRNRIMRPRWRLVVSSVIAGAALLAGQVGQDGAHAQGPPQAVQVEVVNPELQVIVTEEPAGPVPFQARLSGSAVTGDDSITLVSESVPEGMRLVVEHVSLLVDLDAGSRLACAARVLDDFAIKASHALVMFDQRPSNGQDIFAASTPIKLFADSGHTVAFRCGFTEQTDDNNVFSAGISGHMIEK